MDHSTVRVEREARLPIDVEDLWVARQSQHITRLPRSLPELSRTAGADIHHFRHHPHPYGGVRRRTTHRF